ncbi:MAG: hypothetical protein JW751_27485 [Polyangiaceae bacterium]|nr:hypothetical protein [Polyangiaceae bacterium]
MGQLLHPSWLQENIDPVTIELVRRVLLADVAPPEVVEETLLESVRRRRPFLAVLAQQHPEVAGLVTREIERTGVAELDSVVGDPELVAQCPPGMLDTLGVVPLGIEPTTGEIMAATIDPLDQHAAEELAFHLGSPVLFFYAPIELVLGGRSGEALPARASLPRLRPSRELDEELEALRPPRMPAFDRPSATAVQYRSDPPRALRSEPPIPLVRRSIVPRPSPEPPSATPSIQGLGVAGGGLPVGTAVNASAQGQEGSDPLAAAKAGAGTRDVGSAIEALDWATRPDDVVALLLAGAEAAAERALVFALQGTEHRCRAASSCVADAARVRSIEVAAGHGSVLDRALVDGWYFGALPDDETHRVLVELFGPMAGDVYVRSVVVLERPALTVVATGFDVASIGTRQVDELVAAAAEALERIVRARKNR